MAYTAQGIDDKSPLLKKFNEVKKFVDVNGGQFVSYNRFNKWLNRRKCRRFEVDTFATIELYVQAVSQEFED